MRKLKSAIPYKEGALITRNIKNFATGEIEVQNAFLKVKSCTQTTSAYLKGKNIYELEVDIVESDRLIKYEFMP